MHLTLMRRGMKQEAELTSREDVTKDTVLSPAVGSVSKGKVTYSGFWLDSFKSFDFFLILKLLKNEF